MNGEVIFSIKVLLVSRLNRQKGDMDMNTTYWDFLLLDRRKVKYRINIVQKLFLKKNKIYWDSK